MPIIIENITGWVTNAPIQKSHANYYRLRVNNEEITAFHHVPNDGLAECLRRAAEAVDKKEAGDDRR